MPYDTSVTERKGCNYCLRGKELESSNTLSVWINDDDCNGNSTIKIRSNADYIDEVVKINYCPICGKELLK